MNQKAFSQDFTENLLREQGILAENHSGFGGKTGEHLAKALLEQDIPYRETEQLFKKLRQLLVEKFSISHGQQKSWMHENLSDTAIATAAMVQGLHKTAAQYFTQAIDNLPQDDQSNDNVYKKAKLLNNLGCSIAGVGDYEKAGFLREQGSALADSIHARNLHWALYHNMSGALENNKQYELAQEHYTTIINTLNSHEYNSLVEKAYFNYIFMLEDRMADVKKAKNKAVRGRDYQAAAAGRDKEKDLGNLCDTICEDYIEYLSEHIDNPEVQDIVLTLKD